MTTPLILMKSLVGSRLYNLHTEESDYDYRYVQVSPLVHALSPFRNLDTKSTVNGKEDDTIWEFRMFCKYAANGNPSVYEALFSDTLEWLPNLVISENSKNCLALQELGKEMIANRSRFLSARRVFDAHRGYATAQLKKMNWAQKDMRHRKALTAYMRILRQGTELLRTGSFIPRFENTDSFRCVLMQVKTQDVTQDSISKAMAILEEEIQSAFDNNVLPEEPNYAYIEDLITRAYVLMN